MVDKPKTDTVMKFVLNGRPVISECTLQPTQGDSLMDGFQYTLQNFFEIHEFDFGMSVKEADDKKTTTDSGAFADWRSAESKGELYKKVAKKYPFEFDKFSFKRALDRASPIFFANCCSSTTFDEATIVKRMAQGNDNMPVGVMRIDFTNVLLTGIDWSDGELVSETVDFICQKMKVTLLSQSADGTWAKSTKKVITWDPEKDASTGQVLKSMTGGG